MSHPFYHFKAETDKDQSIQHTERLLEKSDFRKQNAFSCFPTMEKNKIKNPRYYAIFSPCVHIYTTYSYFCVSV